MSGSNNPAEERIFDSLFLDENSEIKPPFYQNSTYLIDGELREWKGEFFNVKSPIIYKNQTSGSSRIIIGRYPMLTKEAVRQWPSQAKQQKQPQPQPQQQQQQQQKKLLP